MSFLIQAGSALRLLSLFPTFYNIVCLFDFFSMQSSRTPSERPPSVRPDDESADAAADTTNGSRLFPFPSGSELNGRLRRLIAVYQKENKKEELRIAALGKRNERRDRIEQVSSRDEYDGLLVITFSIKHIVR